MASKYKTKVVLIHPTNRMLVDPQSYFPLSLLYIGAMLEQEGALVEIADLRGKDINITQIPKGDIYAFTATTGDIDECKEIAMRLKKSNPKSVTVIGGAHATIMPADCANHFDAIVRGDGELAIIDVLNGKRGIITHPLEGDLDTLPFPARHLIGEAGFSHTMFAGEKYGTNPKTTVIISSRGCPFNCSFCANWDRRVRFRKPERVAEEIKGVVDKWNCRYFHFEDDTFSVSTNRVFQLCEELKSLGVKWKVHTRSECMNYEVAKEMKDAGCVEVAFGVESADDFVLQKANKGVTAEDHRDAVLVAKEAGLVAKVYWITGLPIETKHTIELNKQFMIQTKPDKWSLSRLTPYPGCDIWNHPEKYGVKWIDEDFLHFWNFPEHTTIEYEDTSREELDRRYKEFYVWLKSDIWKK